MAGELILIVEDNERNAKLLRDVLLATGYRVRHTVTAEEGLDVARQDKPDLILMDIQLPGMSGTDALKQLKGAPDTETIPVIAVTASAMSLERAEILSAGFDGYQAKPISVKAVMAEIRALLDRPAAGA